MKIGYARVFKMVQNLDRQIEALENAGTEKTFKKKMSGKKHDRWERIKRSSLISA